MSAIGKGDWVECDGRWNYRYGQRFPRPAAGELCLVVAMGEHAPFPSIQVQGYVPIEYDVQRFRPIYRPKSEIIQSLLQPILEDA